MARSITSKKRRTRRSLANTDLNGLALAGLILCGMASGAAVIKKVTTAAQPIGKAAMEEFYRVTEQSKAAEAAIVGPTITIGVPIELAEPREIIPETALAGRTTSFRAGTEADYNTAFEMANSGFVSVPVGATAEVSGLGGTQTVINTGYGYAVLTPEYRAAIQSAAPNQAAIESAAISKGFATAAQLDAMSAEQRSVYAGTLLANNPTII